MSGDGSDLALAPYPAETAPRDGRVLRGYFERGPSEAMFKAVAWDVRAGWRVDLYDRRLDRGWVLRSWGAD